MRHACSTRSPARRGSVLIVVVAVLVLLALVGTAYITQTRTDRYTAGVIAARAQSDLIGQDAVQQALLATIAGVDTAASVNGPITFRPAGTRTLNGSPVAPDPTDDTATLAWLPWVGPDRTRVSTNGTISLRGDAWLSPRVPVRGINDDPTDARFVRWTAIGAPLFGSEFESPAIMGVGGSAATAWTNRVSDTLPSGSRAFLSPTSRRIAYPDGRVVTFPAFFVAEAENMRPIAADADGDGIADSGLFRLPISDRGGLTWYVGYRVVDHGSAVNVNTAWNRAGEYFGNGSTTLGQVNAQDLAGFYLASVGLAQLSRAYNPAGTSAFGNGSPAIDVSTVNSWRWGAGTNAQQADVPDGVVLDASTANDPKLASFDPALVAGSSQTFAASRGDFRFLTIGDAMENLLAVRRSDPGVRSGGVSAGTAALTSSNVNSLRFLRPFDVENSVALAYRFCLQPVDLSPALIERAMPVTTVAANWDYGWNNGANAMLGRQRYEPGESLLWFRQNFDYNAESLTTLSNVFQTARMRRTLLTADNPVSTLVPLKSRDSGTFALASDDMGEVARLGAGSHAAAARVSVNTAAFEDLWRAYWHVMAADLDADGAFGDSPYGSDSTFNDDVAGAAQSGLYFASRHGSPGEHRHRMFRSPLRDGRPGAAVNATDALRLPPSSVVLLRSAIAAVNTVSLRDGIPNPAQPLDIPARSFPLPLSENGTLFTSSDYRVNVFGFKRQPFITEVFANSNDLVADVGTPPGTAPNAGGYIAIELYNPYAEAITLDGTWHLAVVDRSDAPMPSYTIVHTFSGQTVGADDFLVLEPSSYSYRPAAAAGLSGTPVGVAGLDLAFGNELVLVRDVLLNGVTTHMPVDSFDFTGLRRVSLSGSSNAYTWHYARPTNDWRWVYPGRYDGSQNSSSNPRQQGTTAGAGYDVSIPDPDPFAPATSLGGYNNSGVTYTNSFPMQLWNTDQPGPFPVGAGVNYHPFGGFARNGDILHVPFIGSYVVFRDVDGDEAFDPGSDELLEINPITLDAAFADDTDRTNDFDSSGATGVWFEQVGRFCPIGGIEANGRTAGDLAQDGAYDASGANRLRRWHYRWATRLFDYLAIRAPSDDYFPNVAPDVYLLHAQPNDPIPVANEGGTAGQVALQRARGNTPTNADLSAELTVPVEGMVNLNTAPWRVLAALPWMPEGADLDGDGLLDNEQIARAIVRWRDQVELLYTGAPPPAASPIGVFTDAPDRVFRSLFDIYRVPEVLQLQTLLAGGASDIGDVEGDLSPLGRGSGQADFVRNDYEERFSILTRVSNVATVRSDMFTCYVVVQGWRNVGTDAPELVKEQRSAFLLDRSRVAPSGGEVRVTPVPTD